MPAITENCSWHINYRSATYSIARALQRCGSCSQLTPVVAVVLPPGHETLECDEHADEVSAAAEVWEAAEAGALLFLIEYFPEAVQGRLQGLSQNYHPGHAGAGRPYWTNHCSFCGSPQDDFELFCEPEGAFSPTSDEAAALIRLQDVSELFEAEAAGYTYAPELLDQARR
jgi:hypothetical protein